MRIRPDDVFDAIGMVFEVVRRLAIAALVVLIVMYASVILS